MQAGRSVLLCCVGREFFNASSVTRSGPRVEEAWEPVRHVLGSLLLFWVAFFLVAMLPPVAAPSFDRKEGTSPGYAIEVEIWCKVTNHGDSLACFCVSFPDGADRAGCVHGIG